ncbi:MAG: hypothetical protein M1833_001784 [Piccolia ochrophora]|nr:MAG: hypothetical protein M1833_001784 [Piccolia ochrophora]
MEPQIDLELHASPFFFLEGGPEFNVWIVFKLRFYEPLTLSTTSTIFDTAAAFTRNRLEIIDVGTGEKVKLRRDKAIAASDPPENSILTLNPDIEKYRHWSTAPSAGPRRILLDEFDLVPGKRYAVQYRESGITHWSLGSGDDHRASDFETQANQKPIHVNLVSTEPPIFITRERMPSPPPLSATLSTSAPRCALSGEPPFTCFVNWALDGDRPICALLTQTTSSNIGLEIRDPKRRGRRIGPPSDWLGDEGSPPEEIEFVRFGRGSQFLQSYVLKTEAKQDGLVNSDTWNLHSGKTYELTLRSTKWRWLYEDELNDEVLQSDLQCKAALRREPSVELLSECRASFRAE